MSDSGLQAAYVLHRTPYRETSLLVEAFTADSGRVGLVARGARRKRGSGALLEPFLPLLLGWGGRGELGTLTGVEPRPAIGTLPGRRILSGFYLNELLLRLLQRHDPHPELFAVYEETLLHLCEGEEEQWTLRRFEVQLLDALGYGLSLDSTVEGEQVQSGRRYCYHLEQGPLPATGEGGLLIHGETLLALASDAEPGERTLMEAKRLLRAALGTYLGERPLRSRELYRRAVSRPTTTEGKPQ